MYESQVAMETSWVPERRLLEVTVTREFPQGLGWTWEEVRVSVTCHDSVEKFGAMRGWIGGKEELRGSIEISQLVANCSKEQLSLLYEYEVWERPDNQEKQPLISGVVRHPIHLNTEETTGSE